MPPIAIDRLSALNSGAVAATTLAECLAVDHGLLLREVAPALPAASVATIDALAGSGITRRMAACAEILAEHDGNHAVQRLIDHPSDTVRGWAAFVIGRGAQTTFGERLAAMRALADDSHFGVREWAWLALRPHVAADIEAAIAALLPWTSESSAYLRRFATEATRPRGVWSAHIARLKLTPALGEPLLEPLRADTSAYVQDSVANWINDAAKDQPDWARALTSRWLEESRNPATVRICKRALRSIK